MLTAPEVTQHLPHYGETVLECSVQITKGIHENGNDVVLQYGCALLNSGGGIIHMINVDARRHAQAKDLDVWWSGMENKFANILSEDDLCNYYDFIGNFDDTDLYLFVKTAEHLCTLEYRTRLPTDTATHAVSYQSALKILCLPKSEPGTFRDLPPLPDTWRYHKAAENLKKEMKQIQFKLLSSPKESSKYTLPDRIRYLITRYVSAFANHEGGHILFGIEDDRAFVMGEPLSPADQRETVQKVTEKMKSFIWGEPGFVPECGVHWDIAFHPVVNAPKKIHPVICVVSVVRFPGGLFTSEPESYCIGDDDKVKKLSFREWKTMMLVPMRDIQDFKHKFVRLPMKVPDARLIFTLPHSVEQIKTKLFQASEVQVQPRNVLSGLTDHETMTCVTAVLDFFHQDYAFAIAAHCWGLNIPSLVQNMSAHVLDILLISAKYGLHLITFSNDLSSELHAHNQHAARTAKNTIVKHGGCVEKFGIVSHLINVKTPGMLNRFAKDLKRINYPSHYGINAQKIDNILTSLVIAMAAYRPDNMIYRTLVDEANLKENSLDYYHLLTSDQFELLWTQQYTKELWIHGPPGSGKTIAAVQFIKELRRRGCALNEILYISEHERLCDFVRSFEICLSSHRRQFLARNQSETEFDSLYGKVKNIIIDEAQNFKDRDGDWYSLAEDLVKSNNVDPRNTKHGFFWVFMDYANKVHKFNAGLPKIIGKNNFMMSEITRNSAEIFNYAKQFMNQNTADPYSPDSELCPTPKLAHEYKGSKIQIMKSEGDLGTTLRDILHNYSSQGGNLKDVAILFSKRVDSKNCLVSLQEHDASHEIPQTKIQSAQETPKRQFRRSLSEDLTVATVKEYSGLDKKCVIGVNPRLNEEHADFNKLIVNLASRATDDLIIVTPSDELFQKLTHS